MPRRTVAQEEFERGTKVQLGTIRCMRPHCEMCTVEMKSLNGHNLADPRADIEVTARLKVRDFTTDSWEQSGKGAGRKNLRVTVDLENHRLLWKGEELKLVNNDEILDGIQELLTGAKRDKVNLKGDFIKMGGEHFEVDDDGE